MNVPTIRVDDEVYRALQRNAEAFVDTPNDVLRRLLGIGEKMSAFVGEAEAEVNLRRIAPGLHRRRRGELDATPKEEYWIPILQILTENGGKGRVRDIIDALRSRVTLRPDDTGTIGSGEVRWENRAKWARKDMTLGGLLRADSPSGEWEISAQGRQWLANQ